MSFPCARNANLNRKDMMPIDPQTSNADIPVMFNSHVNTTPSPHIVVRNAKKDMANATLIVCQFRGLAVWRQLYIRAGTGTPLLFTQPNRRGAWPDLANDNNIRELA